MSALTIYLDPVNAARAEAVLRQIGFDYSEPDLVGLYLADVESDLRRQGEYAAARELLAAFAPLATLD